MEIVVIAFLILLLIVVVFLGYKLLRFLFKSKGHTVITLSLCGIVVLIVGVNHIFFKKMQFIPSKIYPDLYLIKNPMKDKNELETAIREFVMETVNQESGNLEGPTKTATAYQPLRFYEYSKSWGINVFADAGTAYFLENEEDPSGFVVEELSMYSDLRLATFQMGLCENAQELYCGELIFFNKGEITNTEVLVIQ
ncbi:hypothetical protein [Flagellimonas amoyensis]|uniref:hypothetical protein n=1 Tax=Flagellimonas amoyensis TaxID=2169401 RepID=UPI000D370D4E|nr:hypothetical protein [Allomuricauda amoyensis]